MFSSPRQGECTLPDIPFGEPNVNQLLSATGVPFTLTEENLPAIKDYVIDNWLNPEGDVDPQQFLSYSSVPQFVRLQQNGLIDAIPCSTQKYDRLVLDGGSKPVIDYRLAFSSKFLASGAVPDTTLYGGQRLRFAYDDHNGKLEDIAVRLRPFVDRWARGWLEQELDKPRNPDNLWDRSFATEQEIATLAVLQRFGQTLEHTTMHTRAAATSVDPSIPPANLLAEEFRLGKTTLRILNGPAIIRSFAGRQLPVNEARPSALSMFGELNDHVQPKVNESFLLIAHNPNIYRSWFDLMLGKWALGRTDLRLDAAGPAIETDRSYGYVLRAFGRILVNYFNYTRADLNR